MGGTPPKGYLPQVILNQWFVNFSLRKFVFLKGLQVNLCSKRTYSSNLKSGRPRFIAGAFFFL
jgi:hypothetical protein